MSEGKAASSLTSRKGFPYARGKRRGKQYHMYVLQKIERGLQDAAEGKVYPQGEVEKRMARWIGK